MYMDMNPDSHLIKVKKITPALGVLCANVRALLMDAKQYTLDAKTLRRDSSICTPSFHLLSSVAFELIPKVLIGCEVCLRHKGEEGDASLSYKIREEISNAMANFNHDIERLYENFPDLMYEMEVEEITTFKNGFMSEYRFKLKGMDYLVSVKDIEAARYKAFARKMDVLTDCEGDELITELLRRAFIYVYNKYLEARKELETFASPTI